MIKRRSSVQAEVQGSLSQPAELIDEQDRSLLKGRLKK
jgi:hypothetical protein